mmetsp:Transcript_35211/g.46377  ORF Transcript_35211/g.46377 Transcript_35211/m.46377 type:complete len:101 (+) Transcript_35211:91-393(+)
MRQTEQPSTVEKNKVEEEERQFIKQLKKVLFDSMPNPADVERKYSKNLSINKFSKYREVMEDLKTRSKIDDQKSIQSRSQTCSRFACQKKASTFYMGAGS